MLEAPLKLAPELPAGFRREGDLLRFIAPERGDEAQVHQFLDVVSAVQQQAGRRLKLLVDARRWHSVTARARRLIYERAGELRGLTVGVVYRSLLQRWMGEFLVRATRFQGVMFFRTEKEALRWLTRPVG